ncbi:T9SS type A sorting domain-containing protein, partial [Flavisolibacter sp. BT320]|nr:T9SS type A sorting domain-containing protein [Flavisolibacter longurius]
PTGIAHVNGLFSNVPPDTYTIRASKTGSCDATSGNVVVGNPPVCGGALCTYTQGAYGSAGGKMCDGKGNQYSTFNAIKAAIDAWPGDQIVLGTAARSVIIAKSDAQKVLDYLPGGGKSAKFKHAGTLSINTTSGNSSFRSLYTSTIGKNRYKINNTLLAQTMTLALNMGFSSGLSGFKLEGNKYLVTAKVAGCGSNTMVPCSYTNTWIRGDVVAALGGNKTVGDLFALANKALGGDPVGVSLDAIANVVDAINNAFDGCRLFVRYADAPVSCDAIVSTSTYKKDVASSTLLAETRLSVTAYPNPYSDRLRFVITSPVSGQATLELYNILGQKMRMIYRGNISAGVSQVVEYNVPMVNQGNLLYILRVDGKQVDGKLFHLKQ